MQAGGGGGAGSRWPQPLPQKQQQLHCSGRELHQLHCSNCGSLLAAAAAGGTAPGKLTTCSELRMATLMLVLNRRLMTEQSAARRLVSCAVSVASKKATGWLMSRPNSWLLLHGGGGGKGHCGRSS